MNREQEDVDRRQFAETWLGNGMRVVLVQDPRQENVGVCFSVAGGFAADPKDVSGLGFFVSRAVTRGSARYPGPTGFQAFVADNEIEFRQWTYPTTDDLVATVPNYALLEYMDRLADMMHAPELPKESIEFTEKSYGEVYFEKMSSDAYRAVQVQRHLLADEHRFSFELRKLLKRKDLLRRAHHYVAQRLCPSKMVLIVCGNLPLDTMERYARLSFDRLVVKGEPAQCCTGPGSHPPAQRLPDSDAPGTLARIFTRNDEKTVRLSFRVPLVRGTSAALYLAYLLNTSQPGSLQYRLKAEGLIHAMSAEHRFWSLSILTLDLFLVQTRKGSQQLPRLLSYVLGYLEIIKGMTPRSEFFNQARHYFTTVNKADDFFMVLSRYSAEIQLGARADDLRHAEVPSHLDPAEIRRVAECLTLGNCTILAMSNEHVDTEIYLDNDFYLQYSVAPISVDPCFDGLAPPQLDPLVATSRHPLTVTTELQLICQSPMVYQRAIAGHFYTTLNISLRSPAFERCSPPAQRLYAAMVNHKVWLVNNGAMFDLTIVVVDNALDIRIKSVPDVLPRVVFLLVEYLTTAIGDEHLWKLRELQDEEEHMLELWRSGDPEVQFEPRFEEILKNGTDIDTQERQLREIRGVDSLPDHVRGSIVLLFGGNSQRHAALFISKLMDPLRDAHSFAPRPSDRLIARPLGARPRMGPSRGVTRGSGEDRETSESNRSINEPNAGTSGPNRETSNPNGQTSGPNRDTSGSNRESSGQTRDSSDDENKGPGNDVNEENSDLNSDSGDDQSGSTSSVPHRALSHDQGNMGATSGNRDHYRASKHQSTNSSISDGTHHGPNQARNNENRERSGNSGHPNVPHNDSSSGSRSESHRHSNNVNYSNHHRNSNLDSSSDHHSNSSYDPGNSNNQRNELYGLRDNRYDRNNGYEYTNSGDDHRNTNDDQRSINYDQRTKYDHGNSGNRRSSSYDRSKSSEDSNHNHRSSSTHQSDITYNNDTHDGDHRYSHGDRTTNNRIPHTSGGTGNLGSPFSDIIVATRAPASHFAAVGHDSSWNPSLPHRDSSDLLSFPSSSKSIGSNLVASNSTARAQAPSMHRAHSDNSNGSQPGPSDPSDICCESEPEIEEINEDPARKARRKVIVQDQFEGAAILKVFDFGPFNYPNWATLLVITRLANHVLFQGMRIGHVLCRKVQAEAVRKKGHIWLVVKVIVHGSLEKLESKLHRCISEHMKQHLRRMDSLGLATFRNRVLRDILVTRPILEEEMQRIWAPLWVDPDDVNYFFKMKEALRDLSLHNIRNLYATYILKSEQENARTTLFKRPEYPDSTWLNEAIRRLDYRVLGIYHSSKNSSGWSPAHSDLSDNDDEIADGADMFSEETETSEGEAMLSAATVKSAAIMDIISQYT